MERDIRAKLNEELGHQITGERQVVYILVELRKLLERKRELDKYRTLKFCCDWVVHPRLYKESARIVVGWFDQYEQKYRAESVGVAQSGLHELLEFCEHKKFRRQFIEACEANDIPTDSIADENWWRVFLAHFTEVVKDCPIEAEDENTVYVERVTAQAVNPEMTNVIMPNKQFGIQWKWDRKDMPPNLVISFF